MALKIWDESLSSGYCMPIFNILIQSNHSGGGVMKSLNLFKDKMIETLKEYAFASAYNSVEIRKAALGSEVGAKGAIAVAMGG